MAIFRGTGGAGDASANVTINQVTEKALEAEASATAAASSATSAANSASSASTSATNAAASESNASTSATNASNSATTASNAATAAGNAQTAAETAETNAETAETNAETAEANAVTAQGLAEDAQAYAEEWAVKAEDSLVSTDAGGDGATDYSALHHAAKASASATTASGHADDAETAQGLAEDAQSYAEEWANKAEDSLVSTDAGGNGVDEYSALHHAAKASASATSASNAQTGAETAQGLAEDARDDAITAKNAAETAYDSFDDRYLGAKSSDPSVDNDGDALLEGALYFNSTENEMRVYTGSVWVAVQDLTGDVTVNSITATSADINGGTIDGVTIGGASAGAITATTITGSGDMNIDSGTLFVDASKGNVGIGTTSPRNVAGYVTLALKASNGGLIDINDDDTRIATVGADGSGLSINAVANMPMTFRTNDTEAMRIDSNGTLLVGTTANIFNAKMNLNFSGSGSDNSGIVVRNLGVVGKNFIGFINSGGGGIGAISQNSGSTVNYGTSSDYRLKEDVVPMSDSIARVKALNPVNFAWKIDGTRVDGFIAHEAQEVVPESVAGEKDAVETVDVYDEDGNVTGQEVRPKYQNIDQSKLVPLLTSALQEAIARIETLEAEVATLKGN
jgi:hypothetical protein